MARIAAFVVGAVAIAIAIVLGPTANVAFLVALAFAVAASANLPVIVFSIYWKRFNTSGAVCGLLFGLLASIILILIGPSVMGIDAVTVVGPARHAIQHAPIFPLENPGLLSIPIGFAGALLGTFLVQRIPILFSALKNSKSEPIPDSALKGQPRPSSCLVRRRRNFHFTFAAVDLI